MPGPDRATRHTASIRIRSPDAENNAALRRALAAEAADPLPRATVTVRDDPDDPASFFLEVVSDDLVYMRAALKSYLQWAKATAASLEL